MFRTFPTTGVRYLGRRAIWNVGTPAPRKGKDVVRLVSRSLLVFSIALIAGAATPVAHASQANLDASLAPSSTLLTEPLSAGSVGENMAEKWGVGQVPGFVVDAYPESNELTADIGSPWRFEFLTSFVIRTAVAARESAGVWAGAGALVFTAVCWSYIRWSRRPASFGQYDTPEEEQDYTPPTRRLRRWSGRQLRKRRGDSLPSLNSSRISLQGDATTDRPIRAARLLRSQGVLKRRVENESP
jgi:hypothetical protein